MGQYPFGLTFDPSIKRGDPQKVELQPEYDAPYKARLAAIAKGEAEGKPLPDSQTLCLPMGMPATMMAFFPMEIVTTKKTIYVFADGIDPPRRIFMDGRDIPLWTIWSPPSRDIRSGAGKATRWWWTRGDEDQREAREYAAFRCAADQRTHAASG